MAYRRLPVVQYLSESTVFKGNQIRITLHQRGKYGHIGILLEENNGDGPRRCVGILNNSIKLRRFLGECLEALSHDCSGAELVKDSEDTR